MKPEVVLRRAGFEVDLHERCTFEFRCCLTRSLTDKANGQRSEEAVGRIFAFVGFAPAGKRRYSDLRLRPLNARRSINLVLARRGLRLAEVCRDIQPCRNNLAFFVVRP